MRTGSSQRPYLIRAIYDWIIDNGWTPYLLVDATYGNMTIPVQYVQDGHIVFNLDPNAVKNLAVTDDHILFHARFSGDPMEIVVYPQAVIGIYAKENNEGMFFGTPEPQPNPPSDPSPKSEAVLKRPSLKIVK